MKNYFLALCILLLAGCTKADVESVSYQKIDSPQFYAEFAEGDTRTFVDEKVRLLWNEGDLLTIFTTTLNQKYQFDGETGDNSGTFTQISAPQFGTGNNISANYAVYPYSSSTKISNDEVITLSLPATQQYAEDSFGPNANTMVAVTSGINDYFLPFKNVGGFLRLRLYRDGVTVKSIQLQGNNGEKIAGKATIVAKYGKNPELEMGDDATETITLDCGDGVELGATAAEATDFWIVVPPTTFTKGFTITITDTDGGIMTKSTSKEYIVERNVLKSMSAFEVETEQSIPNNQIWYTTSDGKMLSQYNKNAFGANVVSNACENGKGVITFDGDVISIGDFAFSSCENLKSIIIPDGVTSVGVCAFPYCSNLTAFYGKFASSDNRCLIVDGILNSFAPAGLTVYAIPNGVTSIGNFAFSGCRNLTNITIPSGVTSIGDNTFASCENLASITIPESVILIERAAFSSCSSLTNITIPNGVTTIGVAAFQYCSRLTTITIPNSVTKIEGSTFYRCSGLSSILISDNVTSIGTSAFYECQNLTSVTIPSSVISIGENAFCLCLSLSDVSMTDGIKSIDTGAFTGCSLTSITIPDSVTSIGDGAFGSCKNLTAFYGKFSSEDNRCLVIDGELNAFARYGLTEYTIPNCVTSIGDAFGGCSNLKNITIPNTVMSIKPYAFEGCSNLTTVTIPNSCTEIGRYTFASCSNLSSVYCMPVNPPTGCEGNTFWKNATGRKIYVPYESLDAYLSTDYWYAYADDIVGYEF